MTQSHRSHLVIALDIAKALATMSGETLKGYILMKARASTKPHTLPALTPMLPSQRIFPEPAPIVMVRRRESKSGPAIAEMGVYSTFFGTGDATLQSKVAGFLLRTKVREPMWHNKFCQHIVICLSSLLKWPQAEW